MTARLLFAWFVHLYTALGAVIAFIAILFIEQLRFQEAFFLMTLAVAIDASDGTLARAARVKELLPYFDGDRLEDIIDYSTMSSSHVCCSSAPICCRLRMRVWLVAFPLVASAYGFCQKHAKDGRPFF